jgi:hypothetical protein
MHVHSCAALRGNLDYVHGLDAKRSGFAAVEAGYDLFTRARSRTKCGSSFLTKLDEIRIAGSPTWVRVGS